MRHPLPESYVNLVVGTDALAVWEPSGDLLEDISNVVRCPRASQTTSVDEKPSHQPLAPVKRTTNTLPGDAAIGRVPSHCSKQHALSSSRYPRRQLHHLPRQLEPAFQQQAQHKQQCDTSDAKLYLQNPFSTAQHQQVAEQQQQQQNIKQQTRQQCRLGTVAGSKRSVTHEVVGAGTGWRATKRRNYTPNQQNPSQWKQLQHTMADFTAAPAPSPRGVCCTANTAVALNGAAAANLCWHRHLEQEGHAAAPAQSTSEHQPAAVATVTLKHQSSTRLSGLIPYLDFIPSTEAQAAAALAGLVLFRDYVPATEFPESPQQLPALTCSPRPGDNSHAAAAYEGGVDFRSATAGAAARPAQCPATGPAADQHERSAADDALLVSSGLMMFQSCVPATVFPETALQQQWDKDVEGGCACKQQGHQAAAQTATAAPAAEQVAAVYDDTAAAADAGELGHDMTFDSPSGVAAPERQVNDDPVSICNNDTCTNVAGQGQQCQGQDTRHQPPQPQQQWQQQPRMMDVKLWEDDGETQPQPHAVLHLHHHQHQQQQAPQHDMCQGLWIDAGVTQPQPDVYTQQQQRRQSPWERPPNESISGYTDSGGLQETEPQPHAVVERHLQQQQQQPAQQVLQQRQHIGRFGGHSSSLAALQSVAVVDSDASKGHEAVTSGAPRAAAAAAGGGGEQTPGQTGRLAAAGKADSGWIPTSRTRRLSSRSPSPAAAVSAVVTPPAGALQTTAAADLVKVSPISVGLQLGEAAAAMAVAGQPGTGKHTAEGQWHVPARYRKWNTAGHKPGSLASCWSKAGLLGGGKKVPR